jgi:N-acetyl-anhydromuramyl-L-alanine amidase AmpD
LVLQTKESVQAAVFFLFRSSLSAQRRMKKQVLAMHSLVRDLWRRYPEARVVGHRDLSPDIDKNGKIERWEWIKKCPCFDAVPEFARLRFSYL